MEKDRRTKKADAPENTEKEIKHPNLSQSSLIWRRFRKHRLAMVAGFVLLILYSMAIFAPFLSTTDPYSTDINYKNAPPQRIHFIAEDGFHFRPFVYPLKSEMDMETFELTYKEDKSKKYPIKFFVHGYEYKFLGLFKTDLHLLGTGSEEVPFYPFGCDSLGRGMFARVLYGARISLSIGLIGVAISLFLGILIGGLAGYLGGIIDEVAQRSIELIMSLPRIPLWMAFSAILPSSWSNIQIYFAITIILSMIGWTGLARVVRGKFLALREEDFIVAAELSGRGRLEIIFLHMLPSFLSHIIANLTLSIPAMILGETSLSFLGIGLRPPTISWGVLLKKAQNVTVLAESPWLMIPGIFVVITVLSFNFLGDGIRDAADPYS